METGETRDFGPYGILINVLLIMAVACFIYYGISRHRQKQRILQWAKTKRLLVRRIQGESLLLWVGLSFLGLLIPALFFSMLPGSWLRPSWSVVVQEEYGGQREASIYFIRKNDYVMGERYKNMDIRWR